MCRHAYFNYVKPGVKQDTMNVLHNSPLFGNALLPDTAINTAEQDISNYDSVGVASGPSPGAPQHTNWWGSHRYRPYEHQENRTSGSTDQSYFADPTCVKTVTNQLDPMSNPAPGVVVSSKVVAQSKMDFFQFQTSKTL